MEDPLDALRSLMASYSHPLDALIVPSEDYHQSEYVSARDKRRQFVSGFTGSAGLALITMNDARLWTDGRYFLQATQQLSDRWKLMRIGQDPALDNWLADVSHHLTENKLKDLREKLTQEKARAIIITALDEVAWLYNVRGSDVSYCPVVHAFAIVTSNSAFFYVDQKKVSAEVHSYMEENGIEVRDYGAVDSDVVLLASSQLNPSSAANGTQTKVPNNWGVNSTEIGLAGNGKDEVEEKNPNLIWADSGSCCYSLYSKLNSNQVLLQQSPLALAKAIKNPVELDGLRKAHIRDGAAVVQYLVWLDKQVGSCV
ncbi:hypothetical protein HHK36_002436 [Tetracentron sinense]|uniref:Creatinase N-terminal domain-containing protein n=1 Tax=Tetracentron sinense TaxID=13715 RepID=A0A834ZPD6_TETSI|nr:hypothetical protein HHK36_002436 [Tetracentron sinense]